MNIPVLYEDDEVVVINKPAGLVVHPDGRTKEETLEDWIKSEYPKIAEARVGEPIILTGGEEIQKPGIVHRIDRDTSGVLIITKTQESFLNLKSQFQARTIKKNYKAIVYGGFKIPHGIIDKPIGRSTSDFRKWSAEYGARGELREATTEYFVKGEGKAIAQYEGPSKKKKGDETIILSYLDVFPQTGRTHQIRVHLKSIGHSILGDKVYAPNSPLALGFTRTALHASSVTFKSLKGEEKTIEAPLPEDFKHALAELGLV
ncbi:MAG: RluA family pseudouridine synthase [Patescibacteria group bacterium]